MEGLWSCLCLGKLLSLPSYLASLLQAAGHDKTKTLGTQWNDRTAWHLCGHASCSLSTCGGRSMFRRASFSSRVRILHADTCSCIAGPFRASWGAHSAGDCQTIPFADARPSHACVCWWHHGLAPCSIFQGSGVLNVHQCICHDWLQC